MKDDNKNTITNEFKIYRNGHIDRTHELKRLSRVFTQNIKKSAQTGLECAKSFGNFLDEATSA